MVLLTIQQVADEMQCSTRHVRRIINKGELAVVATGTGQKGDRILREVLDKFYKRKTTNRDASCQSTNVVNIGGYMSKSAAKPSDNLRELKRKRKRQKSNQK